MSEKKIKLQKKVVRREVDRIKEKGMKELLEFIEGLSFFNRCMVCWNILRKNKKSLGL